jgi:hypothetical protein
VPGDQLVKHNEGMGTPTASLGESGLLISMSEPEISQFWNDLQNCDRDFAFPVVDQGPVLLPGVGCPVLISGLSLLLDIGLSCTTPHHDGMQSLFSLLKYPSLISQANDFRFRTGTAQIDTHKKKVISDEFGCGAAFSIARNCFGKTHFLDFRTATEIGLVETAAPQSRQPDFLAWSPQSPNSIMILEAKGTQTSLGYCSSQVADSCEQLAQANVVADGYTQTRVGVGIALMREGAAHQTTIYVGDPEASKSYSYTLKGDVPTAIRRSHYLRVSLLIRDFELTGHLRADSPGYQARNELRRLGGKTFSGSSVSMVSPSSSMSLFVGLDSDIRTFLLLDSSPAVTLFPEPLYSAEAARNSNRLSIVSRDGACLDIQRSAAS